MPKQPSLELASAPKPRRNNVENVGLAKMACLVFLFCTATTITLSGQTFTTLVSFDGTNGQNPYAASLVQGFDGSLYGTTTQGGTNCVPYGCGTVFRITPAGTLTTLYSFCAQANCTDGDEPYAGLIQATDGNFYGTTLVGGNGKIGGGTVFKVDQLGLLTTLYSFCAQTTNCTDGLDPAAPLLQAANGNFYGTTMFGGKAGLGFGTVFEIGPTGTLTTLHSFGTQGGDGLQPWFAGLVQGTDGRFYGTTSGAGFGYNCFAKGCSTVFRITPAGELTTLYSFCSQTNCADGTAAHGIVQAIDGNFYGTTSEDGATNCSVVFGCGTIFKMTPSGTLTTLYRFCAQTNCTDGGSPMAALVQATDGNLYGTTSGGGFENCVTNLISGCGTIFKITPAGVLTTLYTFCTQKYCPDGRLPGGLVQATDGNLYGVTNYGGVHCLLNGGCGTVFKFSVGLRPFVKTLPTFGGVGTKVFILGNNLTGTTSVTFNGAAATFTVVSGTEITTTVPTGATTGAVEVATSGGTLKSNVAFRVRP